MKIALVRQASRHDNTKTCAASWDLGRCANQLITDSGAHITIALGRHQFHGCSNIKPSRVPIVAFTHPTFSPPAGPGFLSFYPLLHLAGQFCLFLEVYPNRHSFIMLASSISAILLGASLCAATPLNPRVVTLDPKATAEAQKRDDTATRAFSGVPIKVERLPFDTQSYANVLLRLQLVSASK